MNHFKLTPVRVQNRIEADKFVDATMEVEDISPGGRVIAAFTGLAVCWVVAILCIAVPVLHFVLVPLAAIGGLVAFVMRFNLHKRRRATELKCPSCSAALPIKSGSFNFPMKDTCGNCRSSLVINAL